MLQFSVYARYCASEEAANRTGGACAEWCPRAAGSGCLR